MIKTARFAPIAGQKKKKQRADVIKLKIIFYEL